MATGVGGAVVRFAGDPATAHVGVVGPSRLDPTIIEFVAPAGTTVEARPTDEPEGHPLHPRQPLVDEIDLSILEVLRRNGRIPIAKLAEEVHVSRASAYSRIERLRTSGVIEGFTTILNPSRIGLDVTALLMVSIEQGAWTSFREKLRDLREVEYCAHAARPRRPRPQHPAPGTRGTRASGLSTVGARWIAPDSAPPLRSRCW